MLQRADRIVYAPQAVFNEVLEKRDIAAQRIVTVTNNWLKVQNVADTTAVELIEIDHLLTAGFRINPNLKSAVLKLVGE